MAAPFFDAFNKGEKRKRVRFIEMGEVSSVETNEGQRPLPNTFHPSTLPTDFYGNTPLHLSCYVDTQNFQAELSNPLTDPIAKNNLGDTPLHIVTKLGDIEKIKLLLADPRVDISATNNAS
mmetsp:Transcript_97703/g.146467  ORF Transcript_97703/g.146467 Transcript_97703/m.146467 type:complete len:121 (+) Transcript_97703:2-364(+)